MVFSSYLFLFGFLPAVLIVYYAAPRRARHVILTVFSYIFYGWANPLFLVLLFATTAIDYVAGRVMAPHGLVAPGARPRRARLALWAAICSNLSLLGFFKYYNFGADNIDALARWLGLPTLGLDSVLRVTLPLGISFYTFQSMSYSIDVYRGHTAAIRSFIDFACYVSMFPQLVAGPIVRFSEVADQLRSRTHTTTKFARGVAFFCVGLAKKILLANPCGKIADLAFGAGSLGSLDAWYGATAYAFQIYFDFSGYSDMAIGLGLMFGFTFAKNFDSPYRSQSITEFWRRWHISLSTWLRDYLFLPLSYSLSRRLDGIRWLGLRDEVWIYSVATAVTMLLGGLWHGAAWKFVVWGGLHGALLVSERLRGRKGFYGSLPSPIRVGVTFTLLLVTWVFFRAPDLPQALRYLGDMLALRDPQEGAGLLAGIMYQPYYLGTVLIAGTVVWTAPQTWDWTRTLTLPKAAAVATLLVMAIVVLSTQAYNPFIYFIF